MIKKQIVWIASCDICKHPYELDQQWSFKTKKDLIENIQENISTGWIIRNKKVYCDECK